MVADDAPLVLTAELDAASFAFFDARRRIWFPPERNHLDAHLTLFHALPVAQQPAICVRLQTLVSATPPIRCRFPRLRPLGHGVAYEVEASPLCALHAELAQAWHPWLRRQDRQRLHPHVTVQNKATAEQVRRAMAVLRTEAPPSAGRIEGLRLWRYLGGPWQLLRTFEFAP